jgi:hypothetical protein
LHYFGAITLFTKNGDSANSSTQALCVERGARGALVLEERPGEAITRQAAFMLRSQLVYLSVYSTCLIPLPMTHHRRGPLGLAEMARCGDRDYAPRISVSRRNSRFTTKKRIEFRAEFINFTNTPIYYSPATGLGPSLGQIRNSQGPRNIQFVLKLYF